MAMASKDTDTTKLLQLFPEEVWILILGNVAEVSNYHQICNSSPYLKTLLQPRRVHLLFPEVVKTLFQRFVDSDSEAKYDEEGWNIKELLPLRRVCRHWRDGVDLVVQNHDYFYQFEMEHLERYHVQFLGDMSDHYPGFHTPEDFIRFKQHFDSSHMGKFRNPFTKRTVYFAVGQSDRLDWLNQYCNACVDFLDTYGKYIWYCTICSLRATRDPIANLEFYNRLKGILQRMPNLRVFQFYNCGVDDFEIPFDSMLENSIQRLPYPTLPHLRMLYSKAMPLPVLKGILERNPQLEIIEALDLESTGSVKIILERATNLLWLAVKLTNAQSLEAFSRARINCQVTKLCLDVSRITLPSWKNLFQALKTQFSNTLDELLLELPCQTNPLSGGGALELANLKKLSLSLQFAIPLEFILPMKYTLEELSVNVQCAKNDTSFKCSLENERELKLYECWETPQKSNMWSMFPRLKLLKTIDNHRRNYWNISTRSDWKVWRSMQ